MTEALPQSFPEFSMSAVDIEIMDAQIAEAQETGDTRVAYGNFYLNDPYRMYRQFVEDQEKMDLPIADPEEVQRSPDLFSDRGRQATWRTFFEDFDNALAECGVEPIDTETLPRDDYWAWQAARIEYRLALLPVYRSMRLLGYSKAELFR